MFSPTEVSNSGKDNVDGSFVAGEKQGGELSMGNESACMGGGQDQQGMGSTEDLKNSSSAAIAQSSPLPLDAPSALASRRQQQLLADCNEIATSTANASASANANASASANANASASASASAATAGGATGSPRILVCGGAGMQDVAYSLQAFHHETNTWVTLPEPHLPRVSAACAGVGASLFVFGGEEAFGSCEAFDADTNAWRVLCPSKACLPGAQAVAVRAAIPQHAWSGNGHTPRPRAGRAGGAPVEQWVMVVGGHDASGAAKDWAALYSPARDGWVELPPLPEPRTHHACVVTGNHVLVIGGIDADAVVTDTVFAFSLTDCEWRDAGVFGALHTARSHAAACRHSADGSVYVVGGFDQFGKPQASVEVLGAGARVWGLGPPLPHARSEMALVSFCGTLCVLGGCCGGADLHDADAILQLSPCAATWGYGDLWSSGRLERRASSGRSVFSTLGGRGGLCAAVVHCALPEPSQEVLLAIEEFECKFGVVNMPSGAKSVYHGIQVLEAEDGVTAEDLLQLPFVPSNVDRLQ